MSYLFLTGATGLLGSYLIRDLSQKGIRLAVLVRPTKFANATQRIEDCMARWEKISGHTLLRPVVLEGNISEPGFGLSRDELNWVSKHCSSLMHNAASLTFIAESPEGEPWTSNVRGTENALAFCNETGIKDFHHVSTAYVCGLRTDLAKEDELDVGQELGNDYEVSKVQAEKLVRSDPHIETTTFYRPAIIIGDSTDGYTSTYHGFYVPLKIISSLISKAASLGLTKEELLASNHAVGERLRDLLNLDGSEHKNYVPVDWVSEMMAHVYADKNLHGETYHLSPRNRVPVSMMHTAFRDSVTEHITKHPVQQATQPEAIDIDWNDFEKHFVSQMEVYRSYWRDDPRFDYSNSSKAAPHLPCPEINQELLEKMCHFALNANFGWPRPQSVIPEVQWGELFKTKQLLTTTEIYRKTVANLEVNGPGGGQWKITECEDGQVFLEEGLDFETSSAIYTNSMTLNDLSQGRLTIEESKLNGSLLMEGSKSLDNLLRNLLGYLVGQVKQLVEVDGTNNG